MTRAILAMVILLALIAAFMAGATAEANWHSWEV